MSQTSASEGRGQRRTHLLLIGAVAIVVGVLSMLFLNPSVPEGECAPEGATQTSGFVDTEKGCRLTIESYNAIREAESGPRWGNIVGVVLILGGVGTGAFGLRRKPAASSAA
jgi:hypothetical protein